jgi:ppGpp synthetase/RelA/SpoT-type nucleotidyltranferase
MIYFSAADRDWAGSFAGEVAGALRARLAASPHWGIDAEHSIGWRVKTEAALARKYGGAPPTDGVANDLIGVRVLAQEIGNLDAIKREIVSTFAELGLAIASENDRFARPDESGYRAIHLDFSIRPARRVPEGVGLELQLTTWLQYFHSRIAHRLFYKVKGDRDPGTVRQLRELSERLHQLDLDVAVLRRVPS